MKNHERKEMDMKQMTLATGADQGAGFEQYRKPTRREAFLATMETIVPWAALCAVIEPCYPKAGNGRPPIGLERMLRIHFLQHWFNLPDLACEEALYDSGCGRQEGNGQQSCSHEGGAEESGAH